MKQNAMVRTVDGARALVVLTGAEGCSTCAGKGGCGILCSSGRKPKEAWAVNRSGAREGDLVEVELDPGASIALIASFFVTPVAGMLVALALQPEGLSGGVAALWSIGGFVAGLILGIATARYLTVRKSFDLVVVSVLASRHWDSGDPEGGEGEGGMDRS
jgi:positive regulator of sigma E activity